MWVWCITLFVCAGSWRNGLGFNALIHAHCPDLIDFKALQPSRHIENLNNAFDVANNELGIPRLLDAEGWYRVCSWARIVAGWALCLKFNLDPLPCTKPQVGFLKAVWGMLLSKLCWTFGFCKSTRIHVMWELKILWNVRSLPPLYYLYYIAWHTSCFSVCT